MIARRIAALAFLTLLVAVAVGSQVVSQPPMTIQGINGIVYIDCVKYSCANIGKGINDAYAALPSPGGTIVLPKRSTCFTFTQQIQITTAGKGALLEGAPGGATCLKWTPSSGTAFTYDVGTSHFPGGGMRDVQLTTVTSPNTSNGIVFGSSNGGEGTYWTNNRIEGFKYPVSTLSGDEKTFIAEFVHNYIGGDATDCTVAIDLEGTSENLVFFHNTIYQCARGMKVVGAASDIYLYSNSFDDNTVWAIDQISGHVWSYGSHFENLGGGTAHYVSNAGGNLFINGGMMLEDSGSGSAVDHFVLSTGTGTYTSVKDVEMYSNGQVVTNGVEFASNSGGEVSVFVNAMGSQIGNSSNAAAYDVAGGPQVVDTSQNYPQSKSTFFGKNAEVRSCTSAPTTAAGTLSRWFDCTTAWDMFNPNVYGDLAHVGILPPGGTVGHGAYFTAPYVLGDAGAGFSGTKTAGACVLTVSHGVVTDITGC
jgi:hypothetical protein